MQAPRTATFETTLIFSVLSGYLALSVVIGRCLANTAYQHDFWSLLLLAPLGALCGFAVASFVHEVTHLLAARLTGCHATKMMLGSGALLHKSRFMGVSFEVRETLWSGAVFYLLTSVENARLKLLLITGSAPLASLALAATALEILRENYSFTHSTFTFNYYFFAFVAGFASACVALLPGIFIPSRYSYAGRLVESDCLRLISVLQLSEIQLAEMASASQTHLLAAAYLDQDTTSAKEAVTEAEASPHDPKAIYTAASLLRAENDARALDYYARLQHLPLPTSARIMFVDEYLTFCLDRNVVASTPTEMEKLSRELAEKYPENLSILGTRGAVLVDLGQVDQGKLILDRVLLATESATDKGYAHAFLALAAKANGDLELARQHADNAAKISPDCPALSRVSDLLSPLGAL